MKKSNSVIMAEWKEHNAFMKKVGSKEKSLEDYILMRQGKYKPVLRGTPPPAPYVSNHKKKYPSGDGVAFAPGKSPKQYTGDLIKGIAVTHKSNLVPVTSQEQIIDITKMRRN